MDRRPFPFRLVVTVAFTTLIVVAVCGAAIHWAGRKAVYVQQVNGLDRIMQLVRDAVPRDRPLSDEDRARLNAIADPLGVRVTLIDGGGSILLDTDATANLMDNHNGRPEVIQARVARGRGDVARQSHTLDEWS